MAILIDNSGLKNLDFKIKIQNKHPLTKMKLSDQILNTLKGYI